MSPDTFPPAPPPRREKKASAKSGEQIEPHSPHSPHNNLPCMQQGDEEAKPPHTSEIDIHEKAPKAPGPLVLPPSAGVQANSRSRLPEQNTKMAELDIALDLHGFILKPSQGAASQHASWQRAYAKKQHEQVWEFSGCGLLPYTILEICAPRTQLAC